MPISEKAKTKGNDLDINILVNRVHHSDKSTHLMLSYFAKKYGISIFDTIIRNRTKYGSSLLSGKSIGEITSGSETIDTNSLIEEIINKG